MTWIEWTWLLSMPAVFIISWGIGAALEEEQDGFGIGLILAFLIFFFGSIIGISNGARQDFEISSREEITTLSSVITDGGLDVVTSDHRHYQFKEHADVKRWEEGGKLFELHYEKNVLFGPDEEYFKIAIEKAEQ